VISPLVRLSFRLFVVTHGDGSERVLQNQVILVVLSLVGESVRVNAGIAAAAQGPVEVDGEATLEPAVGPKSMSWKPSVRFRERSWGLKGAAGGQLFFCSTKVGCTPLSRRAGRLGQSRRGSPPHRADGPKGKPGGSGLLIPTDFREFDASGRPIARKGEDHHREN